MPSPFCFILLCVFTLLSSAASSHTPQKRPKDPSNGPIAALDVLKPAETPSRNVLAVRADTQATTSIEARATVDRAISAGCEKITIATTKCVGSGRCKRPTTKVTTTCHIGVHPQPTFKETLITVTEDKTVKGSDVKTTVKATADVSIVSVPKPSASKAIEFAITPQLRDDFIDLANTFCPNKIKARATGAASCRLPQGKLAEFIQKAQDLPSLEELATLISDSQIANLPAEFRSAAGSQLFFKGVVPAAIGTLLIESVVLNIEKVEAPPKVYHSVASAATTAAKTTTSKSSTQQLAPTLNPGPSEGGYSQYPFNSVQIAGLTSALESIFSTMGPKPTTSRPFCTHHADPQARPGAGGYCECKGKIYTTSPSVYSTITSKGKTTKLTNDCPYTKLPSKTLDLNSPTVKPTSPKSPGVTTITLKSLPPKSPITTPTVIQTTLPLLRGGTQSCWIGGGFYTSSSVFKQVSSFCSSASKQRWWATYNQTSHSTIAKSNNFGFNGGHVVFKDSNVKSSKDYSLSLSAKYLKDACELNANSTQFVDTKVDFTKGKGSWCRNNFMAAINPCKKTNAGKSIEIGFRYHDCVEWNIGPA